MVKRPVSTTFETAVPHDRRDDAAADHRRKRCAACDAIAGGLSDLDHHPQRADGDQRAGKQDKEPNAVGGLAGEPEQTFIRAETHIVHDEFGVIFRCREKRIGNEIAKKKYTTDPAMMMVNRPPQ